MPNVEENSIRLESSIILIGLFFAFFGSKANQLLEPTDSLSFKRRNFVVASHVIGSGAILGGLSYTWYRNTDQTAFHWFNDNDQWLGMDKVGHLFSAFQITRIGTLNYQWAGFNRKQSVLYSAISATSFLTVIELLDGYSDSWGASWGDLAFNTVGVGLAAIAQERNKLQFNLKFSYRINDFAQYRPKVLGSSGIEELLKNYNGQTYWLTVSNSKHLSWLGLSFGYGATGMTGGDQNVSENESGQMIPSFQRSPISRMSLDIQWDKIKTNNIYLKTFLKGISYIKMPFPSLDYHWSSQQLNFAWY